MSFKNPKNLIVVVSVVAALLAGTVLLGGYANIKSTDNEAPAKGCQASGSTGCCPSMAKSAPNSTVFALVSGEVQTETESGCSGTPCATGCPKPCCAGENAEGCCDNPCPIPCPKPCCGTSGSTGCPMTAEKTAVQ